MERNILISNILTRLLYRSNQSQSRDKNQDSFQNQCYINIHCTATWWELLAYLLLSFGDDWKVIEIRCQHGRLRWTLNWGHYSNHVCRSPGCWLGGTWPHCSLHRTPVSSVDTSHRDQFQCWGLGTSAANRLIGEVVQSRRRILLGLLLVESAY